MPWWDPTSWELFSDWGTSAWAEDLGAAVDQSLEWIGQVAATKAWSDEWIDYAAALVAACEEATSPDVEWYWITLAAWWDDTYSEASAAGIEGWAELAATFHQAAGTTATVEESREEGTVGTVAEGTVTNTGSDLEELWETARPYVIGFAALYSLKMIRDLVD